MKTSKKDATNEKVKTRLDMHALTEDEAAFMAFIDENMVGQPKAKQAALRIFRAIHNPLREPDRPIFSVILAGESRTGKNHLVRLLAQWFHGNQKALVKVNGGEYQEKYALSRLIGAPHGYIGHNDANDPSRQPKEGKKDTSAILSQHNLEYSKRGSSNDVIFVLLDEWEKMHMNVINILLAGLDEGESTLANNEDVNFRNVVFIMTSNMGMAELEQAMTSIGFMNDRETGRVATAEEVEAAVRKAYRNTSSPEFRNRIDMLVVYEKLDSDQLLDIVGLEFKNLQARILSTMPDRLFVVSPSDEAKAHLLEEALSGEEGGLANLKRVLNELVLEPLGTAARHGRIAMGDTVEVSVEGGTIVFDKVEGAADLDVFNNIPIIGSDETVSLASALNRKPVEISSGAVATLPLSVPIFQGTMINLSELMFLQRAAELKALAERQSPLMASYEVIVESERDLNHLTTQAFLVVRDLTDFIGAKVLESQTTYEAPFKVILKVRALPGQIELLQVRHMQVSVNLLDD